jgi:hypothetical protein
MSKATPRFLSSGGGKIDYKLAFISCLKDFNYIPGQEFSLLQVVHTGSGAQPTSYPMGITGALSPGVKRQGREADHSPPTSAEVKKNVDLYIHSPIRLHSVVLN